MHFDKDTRGWQTRGILGLRSPKNRHYHKVAGSQSYAVQSEASLNITIAPQHLGTIISATLLSFGSRRDTTFFLIFRRWENLIVLQSIFSSRNMCGCIWVDTVSMTKTTNELHWTRVKPNIVHKYAQFCKLAKL